MSNPLPVLLAFCVFGLSACNTTTEPVEKPVSQKRGPAVITKQAISLSARQRQLVEAEISYDLKDPSSARFRGLRAEQRQLDNGNTSVFVCGEVNAKNSFGAYVGYRPFGVILMNNRVHMSGVWGEDDITGHMTAESVCRSV